MEPLDSFIVERRGRPRLGVSAPARLRPNDWSTTQVDMIDISEAGFRAAGDVCFRIGAYVSLQVPGIGWVEGLIVWQHLGQFGARFVLPISLALFSKIAPRAITATVIGIYYLAFFIANKTVGYVGGLYSELPTTTFWLLHVASAVIGLVAFVLFKLFMGKRLAHTAPEKDVLA